MNAKNQKNEERPSCNVVDSATAQAYEDEALGLLRESGLRVTLPRVLVIRALSRSNCALSAYGIHELIRESGGKVDVVTVYRVLQALMERRLVHRIGVMDGYYACRAGGSHGADMQHLVCRSCGCVQEVAVSGASAELLSDRARQSGFRKDALHVEVLGTCAHCLEADG